jgi:hypothetical protein
VTSYLCLPEHTSLTEGHCFIVPMSHVSCALQLDEDVYKEIQDFRMALTKMFRCKFYSFPKNAREQCQLVVKYSAENRVIGKPCYMSGFEPESFVSEAVAMAIVP